MKSTVSMPPLHAVARAISLQSDGRLSEAERLYESVLETNSRYFGALYGLGLIRLQQRRFDDAVRLLRRAIKIDRNSADAHHHLGFALTGLNRFQEAVQNYQKALAIRPDVAEVHNNLGYALQMAGCGKQAIAQYEKALSIRPAYAEACNNLGNALHLLGKNEDAIEQYEKALAIRPSYAEAHWNLGNACRILDRSAEALSHFRSAIALRPDYIEAHNSLGNELHRVGRSEEAIAHYQKALAIVSDYPDAHMNLAIALRSLGRFEDAIPYYKKAFELRPDYIEMLDHGNALVVLLSLSCLPEPVGNIDVLAQLEKLAKQNSANNPEYEIVAAFARAAALHRVRRYAEAWICLVPANRTLFSQRRHELDDIKRRQRATELRLREKPPANFVSAADGVPISLFIVGPSQSGKTTMERLVGTLDGVKCGGESLIVDDTVRRAREAAQLTNCAWFEDLPPALHAACRDFYVEELVRRAGSAGIFTNTNPLTVFDADLIAGAFPNVRFICVKRDIMDNVLRMYFRLYQKGNVNAYDLTAARDHIFWYHEMMDLLVEKHPSIVRTIRYEDLIANPACTLRIVADLCGVLVTDRQLPAFKGDAGCSLNYQQFMVAEFEWNAEGQ